MINPRITVGIPCYDQAQYLVDAIDSVLTQTVGPHEIIVCNDGSPDNTKDIIKNYPQVKYIEQVNKGLASARNSIIMNMTGDYLLPLDSDDMMMENCIEKITEVIEKTNADIVAPSFKCFGKHTDQVILMPNPRLEDFKSGNRIGYFSAIKKEVLLEVGGYNPKMIWGWEDYDLWFDLLKRSKEIITIPEVLMLYRTKERSMINVANEHGDELWQQIHKNHPDVFTQK